MKDQIKMRKILLLAAAALLVAINTSEAQNKKNWADYGKYQEANKALTQNPDVVFMGNSITENWYKFRPDFFNSRNFAARGISGQVTYQMLARFQSDVVELGPKIVVILAGTNDIAENQGPIAIEQIVENIKSMCDIARANKIKPIVCSVVPCDRFVWRKDLTPADDIIELNRQLKQMAKTNKIQYVDYHTAMDNGEGGLSPELSKDGCHPLDAGYVIMEEIILKALKRK